MFSLLLSFVVLGILIAIIQTLIRDRNEPVIPGSRPTIATIICLWEFLLAGLTLSDQILRIYRRNYAVPPDTITMHRAYTFASAIVTVECILGVLAGIAFWRLKRLAFPLFALKYALSFVSAIAFYMHHAIPASQGLAMRIAVHIDQFVAFTVSVGTVVYVEHITRHTPSQLTTAQVPPLD